jgi:hypothetical protein
MRASILTCSSVAVLCAVSLIAAVGCGAKPTQVGDPSSENGTKTSPSDEPPKWEGATTPPPEEAKPKSSGGTTGVSEAPTRRTDQYDKEATEVVIKRAARQVKENCGAAKDDNGKATGPWGKATLQIQLGRNGHSKGVTVPAPFQGKPTGNCVEKAFANLTFPPWGGSDTEISWEVDLVNPAEPAKK